MKSAAVIAVAVTSVLAIAGAGCEKVSHESISEWESTQKGPEKLADVLAGDYKPDLKAHAAAVLVRIGKEEAARDALSKMPEAERTEVMGPLIDRLWADAEIEGELTRPGPRQIGAKDAMFALRPLASDEIRQRIDARLIEWMTGGYFEGRARSGAASGRMVARAVGSGAGKALMDRAYAVLAKPPGEGGELPRLGDELLGSLAFSGNPKALALLMDLIEKPQKDPTLRRRSMNALHQAFVDPMGLEPVPGKALEPIADRLEAAAKNEELGGRINNDAIELLAAMGPPKCLRPFVSIVSYPHSAPAFRYIGTQRGIRCGGVEGIIPVTEALPVTGSYPEGILDKYLWSEILALPARKEAAQRARTLLDSKSWVARITGVEVLGKLASPETAAADAALVSRLARDRARLRGWYPAKVKKPDPTLGQVAGQVAESLRKVASEAKSK